MLQVPRPRGPGAAVEDRIEARLTEHHAIFETKDLRAVALEQAAGEMPPDQALAIARGMVGDRRVLTLEGGRMTTLAVRVQEQAIERRAAQLAKPAGRDVGHRARAEALREFAERIGGQLNPEQQLALRVLTGPERAAVLIGPAGTGKGVVIDATVCAEQIADHKTIGIAVAGSTAERLGTDSPALQGQTMTLDSLIAVGDGKQLPSIGPGGMFDRLATHTPTVEVQTIYRTKDPAEQKTWQALRAGGTRARDGALRFTRSVAPRRHPRPGRRERRPSLGQARS